MLAILEVVYFLCYTWFLLHNPLVNINFTRVFPFERLPQLKLRESISIRTWLVWWSQGFVVQSSPPQQMSWIVPVKAATQNVSPQNGIRAKPSYILFSRMKFRVKCSFSTAVLTTRWPKPVSIFSLLGYSGYTIRLSWPNAFHLQVLLWVLHISETCWSAVWVGGMGRASKYTKFLLG